MLDVLSFEFTESQKNALSRAVVFQFLFFEGSYMRVVNTDIVYASNLADRCCELAKIYAELNHGMHLFCQSDSLRNIMYPNNSLYAERERLYCERDNVLSLFEGV